MFFFTIQHGLSQVAKKAILQREKGRFAMRYGLYGIAKRPGFKLAECCIVLIFWRPCPSEEAAAIERGLAHGVARAAQAGAVVPVGFEREEAVGVGL